MNILRKITAAIWTLLLTVFISGCTQDIITDRASDLEESRAAQAPVNFECYLQQTQEGLSTRAVSPADALGGMTTGRLKELGFGVFAQYTSNTAWNSYAPTIPFNFMWNQEVTWSDALAGSVTQWTYDPVKYWPNDNQPADDEGATGSQARSYLSFFAYAPYADETDLGADLDITDDGTAEGIVKVSVNNTNAEEAYIYYRTSNEKPFDVNKCVDLLWATQQDRYKMDGGGYINGHVDFLFKHALTKVDITTKLYVDRTASHTSEAYSTELDANTKIFIENATITTPDYYKEGKLMIAPKQTTAKWNYTGVDDAKKLTGFQYNSNSSDAIDDVKYSMRYAAPNIPQNHVITDANDDGVDDETGLTAAETTKAAFDAMEAGVLSSEQQLSSTYTTYMFPPSEDTKDITVNVVYHVVSYDDKLVLNNPKFYSHITNNITASLGNSDFKFEPNKQYKLLLSLGVTSAKFEVYVLDDSGEYILLSAVVKEWDEKVIEGKVE